MSYEAGNRIFVKHPTHSWLTGVVTVVDTKQRTASVRTDDKERNIIGEVLDKVSFEDITSLREDLLDETPDDLLSLTVLHDATLLRCLYIRYMKDVVYTNIGAIVVALNPFNFKIPWYTDDNMPKYLEEGPIIEKNLPHSWAQAHNTFNEMVISQGNQCVLISGESGAGKTEATKIVMKYLAQIAAKQGTPEEREAGLLVGEKLKQCSPVLESFGNGKTVRNDNSSRFGKFMQVKFNSKNLLVGAFTIKYLLEKSRIVTASEGERCYHALYVTTRGWAAPKLGLKADTHYKSLNSGKTLHNGDFDTAEDFKEITDAMTELGMSDDEILSVWKITGGCLHLLNIAFDAAGEGSRVSTKTQADSVFGMRLWEVDGPKLELEFRKTTLIIPGGQTAIKELNPTNAIDVRDATVKAVYNGLFGWLVEKCNDMCDVEADGNWIGLLDIFGFEDFKKNSFEQLCINFANETLQNHYNNFIFTKDMEECRLENIDVTEIKCPDNEPALKLIRDQGGILDMLDEECLLGKGTDLSYLEKLHERWNGKSDFYTKSKMSRDTFVVHHYAGSVTYDVNGWLEKNRDTVKDDIRLLVRASNDPVVAICMDPPAEKKQGGRKITVGGFFNDQVRLLMLMINSTSPHWIRTVKPHPAKKPRNFHGIQTMNQLESSGVLGTVKIRKAGYPVRQTFDKFNIRYKIIVGDLAKEVSGGPLSKAILTKVEMNDKKYAQVGKTKVFMKSEAFPLIERKRNDFLLKHSMTLQRNCRGYQSRKKSGKDFNNFVLQEFARVCVTEYREYLKKSAAIRAEKMRIKQEAQDRFDKGRDTLEADSDREYRQAYADWEEPLVREYEDLLAHLKAERLAMAAEAARLQRLKEEAEEKERQRIAAEKERLRKIEDAIRKKVDEVRNSEPPARYQIQMEFERGLQEIIDTYVLEVNLFKEAEMMFMEKQEVTQRGQIVKQEGDRRKAIFRALMKSSTLDPAMTEEAYTSSVAVKVYALEELERDEMHARMRLTRQFFRPYDQGSVFNQKMLTEAQKAEKMMTRREQLEMARNEQLAKIEAITSSYGRTPNLNKQFAPLPAQDYTTPIRTGRGGSYNKLLGNGKNSETKIPRITVGGPASGQTGYFANNSRFISSTVGRNNGGATNTVKVGGGYAPAALNNFGSEAGSSLASRANRL